MARRTNKEIEDAASAWVIEHEARRGRRAVDTRHAGAPVDLESPSRTIEVKAFGGSARGQDRWLEARQVEEARRNHIRGLLATGQDDRALRLAFTRETEPAVLAPQWTVIEHITMSEALLRTGEHDDAHQLLQASISEAERNRLPHQLQRIVAIAALRSDLAEITADARAAIQRLNESLTLPGTVETS